MIAIITTALLVCSFIAIYFAMNMDNKVRDLRAKRALSQEDLRAHMRDMSDEERATFVANHLNNTDATNALRDQINPPSDDELRYRLIAFKIRIGVIVLAILVLGLIKLLS